MEFSDLVSSISSRTNLNEKIGNYFNRSVFNLRNFSNGLEDIHALQRRIELSTEYFLVPTKPTTPSTTTITEYSTKKTCTGCSEEELSVFRNEVWVVPLLTISGVLLSFIICFELYVLMKATKTTPSRRHLFLGQMLLLGLFMCCALSVIIAASPTPFTCGTVRFGTGVAYSIVFAALLVKCVFLISLNNGVYLPATYQSLLLFFAILIQIAIGIQWLITNPPDIQKVTIDISNQKHSMLVTADDVTKSIVLPLCRTLYTDMILSLIYVIFLIGFVSVLAMKSKNIRSNYRESTYIGLSVLCSIPTWLVWTLSGFVVAERHKDACLGFGLVITSGITFMVMFMPKGRQLAATGKDGVYVEDREEGFSSISRAGSGYSPSFFHFKPPKYSFGSIETEKTLPTITTLQGMYINPEDSNMYTNLEHTMSSNPNVFFQSNNGVHPGMIY